MAWSVAEARAAEKEALKSQNVPGAMSISPIIQAVHLCASVSYRPRFTGLNLYESHIISVPLQHRISPNHCP